MILFVAYFGQNFKVNGIYANLSLLEATGVSTYIPLSGLRNSYCLFFFPPLVSTITFWVVVLMERKHKHTLSNIVLHSIIARQINLTKHSTYMSVSSPSLLSATPILKF